MSELPPEIDTSRPHTARIYDYFLGRKSFVVTGPTEMVGRSRTLGPQDGRKPRVSRAEDRAPLWPDMGNRSIGVLLDGSCGIYALVRRTLDGQSLIRR
jgi:hypothetical protein